MAVRVSILAFFGLLFGMPGSLAQFEEGFSRTDERPLPELLQEGLTHGDYLALRDAGGLLDHPRFRKRALQLLRRHTLFLPQELKVDERLDRRTFLDFFHRERSRLKFSEVLAVFYLTPVEEQTVRYELEPLDEGASVDPAERLRELVDAFRFHLEVGDEAALLQVGKELAALGRREGFLFLCRVLREGRLFQGHLANPARVRNVLCWELVQFRDLEALETLLTLLERGELDEDFVLPLLTQLTNIRLAPEDRVRPLHEQFRHWLDSLHTLPRLRQLGYDRSFSFRKSFFQFPVDYYGKLLGRVESNPWIERNVLEDLKATHHPRALFYLAAQVFRASRDPLRQDADYFASLLETWSGQRVRVEGTAGFIAAHHFDEDPFAALNLLRYWASHYDDYEWDEGKGRFVLKASNLALTQNYERLFRRLNSSNDSVARQAYLLLVEGDPNEVLPLARKYRELIRQFNPTLPSAKHRFLEQLVLLHDFCRRNQVHTRPPARLAFQLRQLAQAQTPRERLAIENQILERLTLDEITSLEVWGLLHANHLENAYSVARIVDWFYSRHWGYILANHRQLRLFLKKATLFAGIGAGGVCAGYLNKFKELSPELRQRLLQLKETESDPDILASIQALLQEDLLRQPEVLNTFLFSPELFTPEQVKALPSWTGEDWSPLLTAYRGCTEPGCRTNLLLYACRHESLEQVPFLIGVLRQQPDEALALQQLEKLCGAPAGTTAREWLERWERDSTNFRTWPQAFFAELKSRLAEQDSLPVEVFNAFAASSHFTPQDLPLLLNALPHLQPSRDVRRLRLPFALSISEHLTYFDSLPIEPRYLDDLPRLFDLQADLNPLFDWFFQQTATLDAEARGRFYLDLFRKNWFLNHIFDGKISRQQTVLIRQALEAYLDQTAYLSEFEELSIEKYLAALQLAHLPLPERLEATIQMPLDEEARRSLQKEVLARVQYADLPTVAPFFPRLAVLDEYNFLNRDFGLPLFDLQAESVGEELVRLHRRLTPLELYVHYLQAFGVDFQDASGRLDFGKIRDLLQYDLVSPFVGSGGQRRDYYVYGLVKVLEYYFGQRLGFHEKLNENQTFFTHFATQRVRAWLAFLEQNGYLESPLLSIPSFNAIGRQR